MRDVGLLPTLSILPQNKVVYSLTKRFVYSLSDSVSSLFCFQVDKVLSVAEDVKNTGNTLFKNQEWKAAVNKYGKALR